MSFRAPCFLPLLDLMHQYTAIYHRAFITCLVSTRGLSPSTGPPPQNSLGYSLESACVARKQKTLYFEPDCLCQKQSPCCSHGNHVNLLSHFRQDSGRHVFPYGSAVCLLFGRVLLVSFHQLLMFYSLRLLLIYY